MGPLAGVKVLEVGGVGPGPFGAMVLADLGAEVVRVERPESAGRPGAVLHRGRRSVCVDLKAEQGVDVVLRLVRASDVLIEGFRPGVMERLGLGPSVCLDANPRLIYARMTGWGQEGPLAGAAGHDINYIALAGALHHFGAFGGPPIPPLNLVGDFGGGGMLLAVGVLAALCERSNSGVGQVIDVSMVDGVALLMATWFSRLAAGTFRKERGTNVLDGSAPNYGAYETADGGYVSIGALEPQFYALLIEASGISAAELGDRNDWRTWPAAREKLATVFRRKTVAEWCDVLEGTDICFAPVLPLAAAPDHPHNRARGTFIDVDGVVQPAPAPRFSRTAPAEPRGAPTAGANTRQILDELGFQPEEVLALYRAGIVPSPGEETSPSLAEEN